MTETLIPLVETQLLESANRLNSAITDIKYQNSLAGLFRTVYTKVMNWINSEHKWKRRAEEKPIETEHSTRSEEIQRLSDNMNSQIEELSSVKEEITSYQTRSYL